MQRCLMVMLSAGLLLGGCSDDKAAGSNTPATAAAPAARAASTMPAKPKLPAGAIDHSRDEQEFELRRALGGVERMISTYEAGGYDTAELKARKAELEQKLGKLSG